MEEQQRINAAHDEAKAAAAEQLGSGGPGRAVQVPMMTPACSRHDRIRFQRWKLKYDEESLSNFAFVFHLRRYSLAGTWCTSRRRRPRRACAVGTDG